MDTKTDPTKTDPNPALDDEGLDAFALDEAPDDEEHPGRLESRGPDLRLAVRRGFFVDATPGIAGGVQLDGGVLRYDPAMPRAERVPLVVAALRERGTRGPRRTGAPAPAPAERDPARVAYELLVAPLREAGSWRVRVSASAPDGSARTLTLDLASVSPEHAASAAISAWISTHAPSEPTDLLAPEPLPPAVLAFLEGRELGGVA